LDFILQDIKLSTPFKTKFGKPNYLVPHSLAKSIRFEKGLSYIQHFIVGSKEEYNKAVTAPILLPIKAI